ncbi:hypothetical protein SEEGA711_12856, partial [Salmonella enterica subsp. enterica serovar Gaminara str. ATCC BAA-711]
MKMKRQRKDKIIGARGGTLNPTSVRTLTPEASASTNSA